MLSYCRTNLNILILLTDFQKFFYSICQENLQFYRKKYLLSFLEWLCTNAHGSRSGSRRSRQTVGGVWGVTQGRISGKSAHYLFQTLKALLHDAIPHREEEYVSQGLVIRNRFLSDLCRKEGTQIGSFTKVCQIVLRVLTGPVISVTKTSDDFW